MFFIETVFWFISFVIVYHMVLHPIFLTYVSKKVASNDQTNTLSEAMVLHDVDIIMPLYNEESCIEPKLRNLLELDYPHEKLHVHIGLDGCSDKTESILQDVLAEPAFESYDIRVTNYSVNRGKIAVLNDLMSTSHSDYVFFTDASALLPQNTVTRLIQHFSNQKVGAVSAGYQLVKPGQDGESRYWQYQTRIKTAESYLGSVLGAHGSCYAIRRELFEPLGAHIINDDFVIPMNIIRQGFDVHYENKVLSLETEGSSTQEDFSRRQRLSLGNIQQVFECVDLLHPRYGWIAFNFLAGKVMRALFPLLLAIVFISSAVLATSHLIYALAFTGQLVVYGFTATGLILKKEPKHGLLYLLYYVASGYIAGLIGSINFIKGQAKYSWQNGRKAQDPLATHIHPVTGFLKRVIDIVGASLGLLLTAPLLPFLALGIKLTSPGPVIYKQERVGLMTEDSMNVFEMYKFRSMRNDAEKDTGAVWAEENDPRLTAVGKFMRKTRLDEIPQFINVLKGDMSLIGPRPERPSIATNLEEEIPFYFERTYGITPGITGLAQVYQGYDQNLDDVRNKLNYDLAYSLSLSRPLDWIKMECQIIFKTIWVMICGRGQ